MIIQFKINSKKNVMNYKTPQKRNKKIVCLIFKCCKKTKKINFSI